jgi:hypothetical protein
MGESEWHNRVRKSLLRLLPRVKQKGRKSWYYKEVRGTKPIPIAFPRTKFSLDYEPDVWCLTRKNEREVYEILDSELNDTDAIIADITQAAICAEWLGLICREDEKTEQKIKDVERIAEVIANNLRDSSNNKLLEHGCQVFGVSCEFRLESLIEDELFETIFGKRHWCLVKTY